MGKISSYTRALVAKLQDVFVVDQTDNNVTATKSVTVEQIGDTIAGTQVHSTLTTSDKTLIGAIKEVAKDKNMADEYDDTHTYNTGDVTIYGNTLYICTANNTTGDFDPSKWTATTIDNVIGSLSTLTTTVKSSVVGAVNEVVTNKLDKDFEIGTRNYICICGSTQTANNKQLAINFSLCKQRTITINSITTAGDATEYKTKFTLVDNSANGYITLYSADSSVAHGRIYTVNLTIA